MKVMLIKKQMAVASPVKETQIEGRFDDYYDPETGVDEFLLTVNLPTGFLPKPATQIPVWVEMQNFNGSRGLDSSQGLFADAESWNTYRLLLCR